MEVQRIIGAAEGREPKQGERRERKKKRERTGHRALQKKNTSPKPLIGKIRETDKSKFSKDTEQKV